jgi:hypothetical protein
MRQYISEDREPIMVANGTAVTTLTTEQGLIAVDIFSSIPANELQPGTMLELTVWGIITVTITSGTLTQTLFPRWGNSSGGVTLGQSIGRTMTAGTNSPWLLRLVGTVRTVGASGTMVVAGTYKSARVTTQVFGGTVATVDTTAANKGIWIGQTMVQSLSASYSSTTQGLALARLN